MAYAWHMHGICMVYAWHMHGIRMAYAWHAGSGAPPRAAAAAASPPPNRACSPGARIGAAARALLSRGHPSRGSPFRCRASPLRRLSRGLPCRAGRPCRAHLCRAHAAHLCPWGAARKSQQRQVTVMVVVASTSASASPTVAVASAAATTTTTIAAPTTTTVETAEPNVGLASKAATAAESACDLEAEARTGATEASRMAEVEMVAPQVCSGACLAEHAWARRGVRSARAARRPCRSGWKASRRSAARRSRSPARAARGTAGPAGALAR